MNELLNHEFVKEYIDSIKQYMLGSKSRNPDDNQFDDRDKLIQYPTARNCLPIEE